MENQVLGEFVRLLKISRKSRIEGPLLQYLSIMLQNLQSDQAIYYCFSNEYVNSIITHQFDFDGADLAPYYVSFLRAVSGKLTRDTLCLLVKVQEETVTSFPLYSEALKFAQHGEKMMQTAIRSVTLNIYDVSDDMVYQFITKPPVSEYFSDLVLGLREQCLQLDAIMHAMQDHYADDKQKELVSMVEKFVDDLYYIKDLLSVGKSCLNSLLTQKLLGLLVVPIMAPFMQSNQNSSIQISPVTSLYIIARVLQVIDRIEMGNSVASLVLYPHVAPDAGGLNKSDSSHGNSKADCSCNEVSKMEASPIPSVKCDEADGIRFEHSFQSNSFVHHFDGLSLDYVDKERKGLISNIFSENQVLFLSSLMILLILAENKDLDPVLSSVIGFSSKKDESCDTSSTELLEESILMKCMPQIFNALLKILGSTPTSLVLMQWCAGWFLQKFVALQRGTLSHHELQTFNLTVRINVRRVLLLACCKTLDLDLDIHNNASFHQSRECLIKEISGCWFDYIPDTFKKEWVACKKALEESSQRKDPIFILMLAFDKKPSDGSNSGTWKSMVDAVKVSILHLQLKAYIIQGHPPADLQINLRKNSMSSPRTSRASDASSASFGSEVPLGNGVPCKISFSTAGVRDIYMIPVAKGVSGKLILVEKHPFNSRRGIVLAMAPLAGLSPKIEDDHPSWLHLRVREFNPHHKDKTIHLNGNNEEPEGRWTLGFSNAEACEAARVLISEETSKQRSAVEAFLAPFLYDNYPRNVSDAQGE
ncbi:TRANSPARENT TESTA 9-like protein [Drosera capensis]